MARSVRGVTTKLLYASLSVSELSHLPPPRDNPLCRRTPPLPRSTRTPPYTTRATLSVVFSAILPHPSRSMLVKMWARVRARALCARSTYVVVVVVAVAAAAASPPQPCFLFLFFSLRESLSRLPLLPDPRLARVVRPSQANKRQHRKYRDSLRSMRENKRTTTTLVHHHHRHPPWPFL